MTSFLKAAAVAALLALAAGLPARAGSLIEIPFDSDNFHNPLTVDNPYWPLVPGTVFTYYAEGEDGCEFDVVTVLDGVDGVEHIGPPYDIDTRVVLDEAYIDEDCNGIVSEDDKEETTFDWHAQDDDGNVWYFGEATLALSDDCEGLCDSSGSWRAGDDGAVPGVFVLRHPEVGDRYYQEFYEGEAEDQAKVVRLGVTVALELDNALLQDEFDDCMKTKEWTHLDSGHVEHKYYCPGTGLVLVQELKGKTLRVELVEIDD